MVQKNRNIPKQWNKPKRYVAIAKICNNTDGTAYCVKYRFNDLLLFTSFLDEKWKDWKWFNVYSNQGSSKGLQLANFTKNNRPKAKFV